MQYYLALLFKAVVLLSVCAILIFTLFLYFSTTKESYDEGQHYGFTIGESKGAVYRMLPRRLQPIATNKNKSAYRVELYNEEQRIPAQINSSFHPSDKAAFSASDKWLIFFDSKFFFDSITLTYCDDKLCQIRRKKQFLEIP